MCKISVIIPAYNVENYIERTVYSVLNQTLKHIEIIVVNDGSTDGTLKVIKSITDERLTIINQENGGVSAARNTGLLAAKGEYLFFLDGDDWIEKVALKEMYDIAKNEDLDILLTDWLLDDDCGNVKYCKMNNIITDDYFKEVLLSNFSAGQGGKLYKRSLYIDNNITYPTSVSLGEDLYINVKLSYFSKRIKCINKAYLHYIKRENSITKTYDEKIYDIFSSIELLREFMVEKGVMKKYELEFEYLEFLHTYFARVITFESLNIKIHREIYDIGRKKYKQYLKNTYINKYIQSSRVDLRMIERNFRYHYILGVITLSAIQRAKRVKRLLILVR